MRPFVREFIDDVLGAAHWEDAIEAFDVLRDDLLIDDGLKVARHKSEMMWLGANDPPAELVEKRAVRWINLRYGKAASMTTLGVEVSPLSLEEDEVGTARLEKRVHEAAVLFERLEKAPGHLALYLAGYCGVPRLDWLLRAARWPRTRSGSGTSCCRSWRR